MTNFRLFTVGGYLSYRALFGWLNPYMYSLTLLFPCVAQLTFFVYLGRAAHVGSDTYYVAGNALLAAATPSLFGMAQAVAGERYANTLIFLIASPANRIAVFGGRALPGTVNGMVVSAWTLAIAALLFRIAIPLHALAPLALVIATTSFSCVGLGLVNAALGLRWRETAVLGNLLLFVLLMFCGVNVPLDRLPPWLATAAQGLPVTHGAKAARELLAGAPLGHVATLIGAEALVGACYLATGLIALRLFELEARRGATLEVA
jgi:ABC-2 type transport system permease protein